MEPAQDCCINPTYTPSPFYLRFEAMLCRQDQHRQVQLAAICFLGRIRDPCARRTLEHMAEHEKGAVRQRAAENFDRLRDQVRVSRPVTAN